MLCSPSPVRALSLPRRCCWCSPSCSYQTCASGLRGSSAAVALSSERAASEALRICPWFLSAAVSADCSSPSSETRPRSFFAVRCPSPAWFPASARHPTSSHNLQHTLFHSPHWSRCTQSPKLWCMTDDLTCLRSAHPPPPKSGTAHPH